MYGLFDLSKDISQDPSLFWDLDRYEHNFVITYFSNLSELKTPNSNLPVIEIYYKN